MSDQSLDDLAIRDYEVLKASPHFRVTEGQELGGAWSVHIHEQLGTANPFPGIIEQSNNPRLAQLGAIRRFKEWQAESQKRHEEMAKIPIPPSYEEQVLALLTEIRDELRKANKRPLYIVVNSPEALKDLASRIRAEEDLT